MSLVDLGKRLLDAAKKGDTEDVRMLMTNGAPFTTDWLGTSPLHFASMYGHEATAEVLLRAGISRDARTKVDRTPLHVAAQNGHTNIVELLIKNQADVEAKDMLKMTPLHWAVEKGHVPVIEILLKHGADVHCENKFDKSPIDVAVWNGRYDISQLLQTKQMENEGASTSGASRGITVSESDAAAAELTVSEDAIPTSALVELVTNHNTGTVPKTSVSSDQSSTSVLATLAALAEATAPLSASAAGTSAAEALNWLETHGITTVANDQPSVVTAIEGGQGFALTEAGKLALKFVKQGSQGGSDDEQGDKQMKVITIVTEQDGTTQESQVVVMREESTGNGDGSDGEPLAKKSRSSGDSVDGEHDAIARWLQGKQSFETLDQNDLRKQLEEVQKQAEAYKLQLKQKEEEAEVYKKQLNEIASKTPPSS
ncbi:GA-binding protein subunit beta-1-like [Lingula anatina]|uniref:GA-binding protein subunit beta-1-like n=1 Tax=Lingula anatina TaxID=7574 RepID=A0A1S3J7N2_LINAN|nr:GA-binding protein subunit beta-1-like [Lingula anatina]XP_013406241.1 GA-binding protein subunit beta-1-like [Lingula anatina]|eukprot:XP_013406240.1 GA-binding protein subunit beta-1-like [Lingula anatina]